MKSFVVLFVLAGCTAEDASVTSAPLVGVSGGSGLAEAPTDPRSATLTFAAGWTQTQAGVIVPGGSVVIDYDATRLTTCRGAGWDVIAHVRSDPDGELFAASVRDGAATIVVPTDGAHQLELWFENSDTSGCDAWDSAYGANYVYAVETPPQWLGLPTNPSTRDSSSHCNGGSDAASGFAFDTWTRQQAAITNLCFQVYQAGETDATDPELWQQLDVELHWRLDGSTSSTAWTTTPVDYDARVGNNAQYALSWRELDPFRDYHCPEVTPTPTTDGQYVEIQLEYFISVNGAELRPEPAAAYGATFSDYPSNPWRTADCL